MDFWHFFCIHAQIIGTFPIPPAWQIFVPKESLQPGVCLVSFVIFSILSDWCWSTDEITRNKHNHNQDQDCYRHLWVEQGISVRTGGLTRFLMNFCTDLIRITESWLHCKNMFASGAFQGCCDRRVLRQSSILFCTKPERNWSKI